MLVGQAASVVLGDARLHNYLRDMSVDDTFYYYGIARNFAAGHFSTFDSVNLTNGYHPLWAWLLVPFFWLRSDPVQVLPLLKSWELALLCAASLGVVLAARRIGITWAILVAIPFSVLAFEGVTVGMEGAALLALLAAASFLVPRALDRPSDRRAWLALTLVLALLPWARLEAMAISVSVAVLVAFYVRWQHLKPTWPSRRVLATVAASLTTYFVYNALVFGSAVPVSGRLKSFWSGKWWALEGGYDFWRNVRAVSQHPNYVETLTLAGIVLVILTVSWLCPRYRTTAYH